VEAEQRAAALEVLSYDVELDLREVAGGTFGSRTVVRFDARPGAASFADVQAAEVRRAELNGDPVDGPVGGRLHLDRLQEHNELVVEAVMTYSNDGEGLHRHVDPADGRTYLYAMSFLDAAPRWFACFDQPDLKAPITLRVRCDDDWTLAGNGAATEVAPGSWELAATPPLPTYTATVIAGPWHSVEREHDGIRLVLHCRRSLAEHLDRDADELFAHTGRCFDELHRLFGIRYRLSSRTSTPARWRTRAA
jgi:aminopeptidase N